MFYQALELLNYLTLFAFLDFPTLHILRSPICTFEYLRHCIALYCIRMPVIIQLLCVTPRVNKTYTWFDFTLYLGETDNTKLSFSFTSS